MANYVEDLGSCKDCCYSKCDELMVIQYYQQLLDKMPLHSTSDNNDKLSNEEWFNNINTVTVINNLTT